MNTFVYVCKLIVYWGMVMLCSVAANAAAQRCTGIWWLGLLASLVVGIVSGFIPRPQRANAGQSQPTSERGEEPQLKEKN